MRIWCARHSAKWRACIVREHRGRVPAVDHHTSWLRRLLDDIGGLRQLLDAR